MVIDTSALIAVLLNEPRQRGFAGDEIGNNPPALTASFLEAAIDDFAQTDVVPAAW